MKIWHIVNVVVAQFLLCLLIPNDLFGFKTVWKMHINGYEWKESGVFPRLTTCDIAIRQYSGEIGDRIKHEQTQCFLAANNYIEKVFFWTWIIFVVLFFINLYSLCNWSWKIWNSKIIVQQYIEERLEKEQSKETLAEYANLLLPDARFTILMVAAQSHEMIGAADLVTGYMEWKNIRY
uniref:Innexin n=1 Tax=Panagrolaimus superbus TaxID=310955 RepID=A0A914XYX0_9BILA